MSSCALTHLGDMPVRSKQTGGQVISSRGATESFFAFRCSICCITGDGVNCYWRRVYKAGGRFNLDQNQLCNDILSLPAFLERCKNEKTPVKESVLLQTPCCKLSNTGWREDDRYSAETLLHWVCIVKKLSDCHDSIPTGYEFILTCNNTTVSSEEEHLHSHCSCLESELLTEA